MATHYSKEKEQMLSNLRDVTWFLLKYLPKERTLDLDFDKARSNPDETVRRIVDFCGLAPSKRQIIQATFSILPAVRGKTQAWVEGSFFKYV